MSTVPSDTFGMKGGKKTLPALFFQTVEKAGARPFSRTFRDEADEPKTTWKTVSWTEAGAKVLKLATVLQKECDVKPGDRVLLLQDSGPESILFIYAVMSCGASFVIREPRMDPETVKMMVDLVEPKCVVTQPESRSKYVYIGMDASGQPLEMEEQNHPANVTKWLTDAAADAAKYPLLAKNGVPQVVDTDLCWAAGTDAADSSDDLSEEDGIGMMVTTSGTTGKPKAVMHSQRGMYYTSLQCHQAMPEHEFGAMCLPFDQGYVSYTMVLAAQCRLGMCLHFVDRPLLVGFFSNGWPKALQPRPTIILLLADSVGKLYKKMNEKVGKKAFLRRCFQRRIDARVAHIKKTGTAPDGNLKGAGWGLRNFLGNVVAKKLRGAFGGKATTIVTGAAKCNEEAIEFFSGAGIRVLESYASTEGFITTLNRGDRHVIGSVGNVCPPELPGPKPTIPITELKIDPEEKEGEGGKIYFRGETVMKGYYNLPEKTAQVLAADGWYDSGDLGKWEEVTTQEKTPRTFKVLKITGSDGRRFPLALDGMPWVWPELLEGYAVESQMVRDTCFVGTNKLYLQVIVNLADPLVNPGEADRIKSLSPEQQQQELLEDIWAKMKEQGVEAHEYPLRVLIEEKDMIRTATGKHKKRENVEADLRYKVRLDKGWADEEGMYPPAKAILEALKAAHH